MKVHTLIRLLMLMVFVTLLSGEISLAAEKVTTWNFDQDQVGGPPAGFSFGRTGEGQAGRWVVVSEKSAPSGSQVLAQMDADPTDYRFPVAVANAPMVKDLRFSVQCKAVSGQIDQAAGLVFRYQDENNYYVTRANALENNVRLYKIVNGRRQQFAGWNGSVTANTWHDYRVEVKGDHFEVYWDGQKVIDARDATFSAAGKIGVWTKADSVTTFDDLLVKPLNR